MIQVDVRMARKAFFDQKVVKDAIDRARQRVLARGGALVRIIARRSMRERKWRPGAKGSPPGQPPFARKGHVDARGNPAPQRDKLIRRRIEFAFDFSTRSAVAGPEVLRGGGTGAPANLEFGGTAGKARRIVRRKVGGSGEIRTSQGGISGVRDKVGGGFDRARKATTTRVVRNTKGQPVRVAYAKLKTQAQADRANRINEAIFGGGFGVVTIAPRPFMRPALEKAAPSLPSHWKNSVRSA